MNWPSQTTAALLALLLAAGPVWPAEQKSAPIRWQGWSAEVFAKAQREHRFVLLDLEAVWCHWCHVMDAETYRDPEVVRLIGEHYLAIKVDQDARPDLANRYEDYGWPATIIYAPDGSELVKRSGYIPPPGMAALLQAVVDDPTPGPSIRAEAPVVPSDHGLTLPQTEALQKAFLDQYDSKQGGWGFVHKYLDGASLEYALMRARQGDVAAKTMARQSLDAGRALLDPVWGGVYQYSTGGGWSEPHFEKIMSIQAQNLRLYSLAWMQDAQHTDLDTARAIAGYVLRFLKAPDGSFYTSQDADLKPGEHAAEYFALDDAGRRRLGLPKIDQHRYARENGWAIEALALYASASGDRDALQAARGAAQWVIANRGLPGGGYRHDQRDAAGPYLGDTLAMGRAFLALHAATGERPWLTHARLAARYIDRHFASANGAGYRTATGRKANGAPPPLRDENVDLSRFSSRLYQYTGSAADLAMANSALRWAASPALATRFPAAAPLLADWEANHAPTHLTVVGAKSDLAAHSLFAVANAYPSTAARIEWWDPSEGALPNADVQYPQLKHAAAFVCSERRCSAPITDAALLRRRIAAGLGN